MTFHYAGQSRGGSHAKAAREPEPQATGEWLQPTAVPHNTPNLFIHITPVPNTHDEDQYPAIIYLCKKPVISNPVSPFSCMIGG